MNKLTKYMSLALSVVVLASCGPKGPTGVVIPAEGHLYSDYFAGESYKDTYNALIPETINKALNYLVFNDGARAKHWANFVDGLLLQNEFGVLEKQLALTAQEEGQQRFSFDVRTDVPWVMWNGEQYSAKIGGKSVPQFVSAEDFLTSAKYVLDFKKGSQLVYLYANFIEGAAEYYQYTFIKSKALGGDAKYSEIFENPELCAEEINKLVLKQTGHENHATADDIDAIDKFERVGIKVTKKPSSNGGGQITYILKNQAFYFPTLLAYSCYLPTNSYFLKEAKSLFGNDKEHLLYCGPFTLFKHTETTIQYKKNPLYWNADRVTLETINYKKIALDGGDDYVRKEFEDGNIDAFGLSVEDSEGWQQYVIGPDGTGTIENPYNPYVNSRDVDYIDYVYGLQINVNRASNSTNSEVSRVSYAQHGPQDAEGGITHIRNAEKALRIEEVRRLILAAFDTDEYNRRYSKNESFAGQYQINTFVPKGFVQDENGHDYTMTHYYKAYAEWLQEKEGLAELPDWDNEYDEAGEITRESDIHKLLKQGQNSGTMIKDKNLIPGKPNEYTPNEEGRAELKELRDEAVAAIDAYNEINADDPIRWPVQIEMFSMWANTDMNAKDSALILSMNRRLNNAYEKTDGTEYKSFDRKSVQKATNGKGFLVIPTYDIDIATADKASNGGNFDIATQWGWGPDYGDPMSYMNTYRRHGDWSNILGFVNDETTTSYHMVDGVLDEYNLLEDYSTQVETADKIYDNVNLRYEEFAKAEVMLINDLCIFKPLTMTGQGRNLSVSLAAGYHAPQGSYGLARDRQDGIIVLVSAIDRNKRKECMNKFNAAKSAYIKEHGTINIY